VVLVGLIVAGVVLWCVIVLLAAGFLALGSRADAPPGLTDSCEELPQRRRRFGRWRRPRRAAAGELRGLQ